MAARAEQAAATRARVLGAAVEFLVERSFHSLTLAAVARQAGVTVRTVMRLFGDKEGLLRAALAAERRRLHGPPSPGDIASSIAALFDDYERIGDAVVRRLADEDEVPALHAFLESGRANHRRWVEQSFAPVLAGFAGAARTEVRRALLVGTDVYLWKLLRRDLGLGRRAAEKVVRRLIDGLCAAPPRKGG